MRLALGESLILEDERISGESEFVPNPQQEIVDLQTRFVPHLVIAAASKFRLHRGWRAKC
jgi:hypothetical protein